MMNNLTRNDAAVASEVTHHGAAKELAFFVVNQLPLEVTPEVLAELAIYFRFLVQDGELECDRTRCKFFSPRQSMLEALPTELHEVADDWVTEHLGHANWLGRTLSEEQ